MSATLSERRGKFQEEQRKHEAREARKRAWYREQSERLGLTPEQIEAAILHGWRGEDIAALPASRVEELEGVGKV